MKTGSRNYSDTLGYSSMGRSARLGVPKSGLSGLKTASPRGLHGNVGAYGSDKESLSGRSRRSKSRKQMGSSKTDIPVYKKRNLDFTDFAYKEAVNKLKFLLADTYTPPAKSFYHKHVVDDSGEDTDSMVGRPILSDISKYLPTTSNLSRYGSIRKLNYPSSYGLRDNSSYLPMQRHMGCPAVKTHVIAPSVHSNDGSTGTVVAAPPPPELLSFIEKQESYIEQLEKESQFCRDELGNLLSKVKDVISENEALTDQAKSGFTRSVMRTIETSESDETEPDYHSSAKHITTRTPLEGPNIIFESRISELEAQLAQANIDLKRMSEDKSVTLYQKGSSSYGGLENGCSDNNYKKQIENLQRDKRNLEETVRKLQTSIGELKETDAHNFSKTQRNRDLVDQVVFEKAQVEIEIRRLKEELDRQHERVREVQNEMSRRIAEERASAERRYNYQVDQLGGDLSSQWEQASKLSLDLERQKRIESELKRDLTQKSAQIDELKSELKGKSCSMMSDFAQMSAEKQSLEQDLTSVRLQLERAERASRVECSRLNAEIGSLRQRLDRADADLLHSRRENLRLCDQIASLEKQIALGDLNNEPRPKDVAKIMADMETKHTATVSELEGMIQGQRQLMEKLTVECKTLTQRLEDTTLKNKTEKQHLHHTNTELMDRLKRVWSSYKDLSHYRGTSQTSDDSDAHNSKQPPDGVDVSAKISKKESHKEHCLSNSWTQTRNQSLDPQIATNPSTPQETAPLRNEMTIQLANENTPSSKSTLETDQPLKSGAAGKEPPTHHRFQPTSYQHKQPHQTAYHSNQSTTSSSMEMEQVEITSSEEQKLTTKQTTDSMTLKYNRQQPAFTDRRNTIKQQQTQPTTTNSNTNSKRMTRRHTQPLDMRDNTINSTTKPMIQMRRNSMINIQPQSMIHPHMLNSNSTNPLSRNNPNPSSSNSRHHHQQTSFSSQHHKHQHDNSCNNSNNLHYNNPNHRQHNNDKQQQQQQQRHPQPTDQPSQSTLNRNRAAEVWTSVRGRELMVEVEVEREADECHAMGINPSSHFGRHQPQPINLCRNSLPRKQPFVHTDTDEEQCIRTFSQQLPVMCISSPSLFGSSSREDSPEIEMMSPNLALQM